jgi:hypothetical protein
VGLGKHTGQMQNRCLSTSYMLFISPMMVLSSAGSYVMCLSLPIQGQRFFLELFSGAGLVAAAASSRGIPAFGLDRKDGWDLAQDDVIQCISSFLSRGLVAALMLDPPCESWSRARRGKRGLLQPKGWPCRVRSPEHIWGLPLETLRPQDQAVLLNGNACLKACLSLIRLCLSYGVPVGLENPSSSMMFTVQELLDLAATPGPFSSSAGSADGPPSHRCYPALNQKRNFLVVSRF